MKSTPGVVRPLRWVRWTLILCLAAAMLWLAGKHLLVPQADHAWELKTHEVINNISSDGQWALVSTVPNGNRVIQKQNGVTLRHATNGALHKVLPLPLAMGEISFFGFSPDGQYVWHAQETQLRMLHVDTERCDTFSSIPRSADGTYSYIQGNQIVWSPDSQYAAILTLNEVILWHSREWRVLHRKPINWDPREHGYNFRMMFSPESNFLVITRAHHLEIWDTHMGRLVTQHLVDEGVATAEQQGRVDIRFPANDTVSALYWDQRLERQQGRQYHLPTGKYISSKLLADRYNIAPLQHHGYQLFFGDGQQITVACRVHMMSFDPQSADRFISVQIETNREWTLWNDVAKRFPWLKMKQLATRERHLHVWDLTTRQMLINIDISGDTRTSLAAGGTRLLVQEQNTVTVYNLPAQTAWKGFACVCAVVLGMLLVMVYWPTLGRGVHALVR